MAGHTGTGGYRRARRATPLTGTPTYTAGWTSRPESITGVTAPVQRHVGHYSNPRAVPNTHIQQVLVT